MCVSLATTSSMYSGTPSPAPHFGPVARNGAGLVAATNCWSPSVSGASGVTAPSGESFDVAAVQTTSTRRSSTPGSPVTASTVEGRTTARPRRGSGRGRGRDRPADSRGQRRRCVGQFASVTARAFVAGVGDDAGTGQQSTIVVGSSPHELIRPCSNSSRSPCPVARLMPQRRSSRERIGCRPASPWNGEPNSVSTVAPDRSARSATAVASRLLPMPDSPSSATPGVVSVPASASRQRRCTAISW